MKKPDTAVFSENEASEIVRLAVELQESSSELAHSYTPGITLDELRRVAAEVGVTEHFLEEALRRKGKAAPATHADPFKGTYEKVIEGELRPEEFDILLDEFKSIPNVPGPNQVGRTLRGKTVVGATQADVTITSRNGRTRLKIDYAKGAGCFLAFPAAFVTFIAMFVSMGAGAPWIGLIVLLLAVFVVGKSFGTVNRYMDNQIAQLGDRLVDKIEAAIEGSRAQPLPSANAEGPETAIHQSS